MSKPVILLIDDRPETSMLGDAVDVVPLNPIDEGFESALVAALSKADLILLDHNLHLDQKLSLTASDGASFVGHLRSWARAAELPLPPLVIFTNEDEAFADEVPAIGPALPLGGSFVGREARIAPTLDVEWLIFKGTENVVDLVHSLAKAAKALRETAGDARLNFGEIASYLGVPKNAVWTEIALGQLAKWRPPENEIRSSAAAGARGVTPLLRWLLHQVLPCPGLLLSDLYASWSLGIEPKDFVQLLARNGDHPWVRDLQHAQYDGAASALFKRRWWAAGIDFAGWRLRERGMEFGSFQAALDQLAGPDLHPTAPDQIVIVNSDLEEVGLTALDKAVRLNPPGWPAEAIELWMKRDEATADDVAQTMIDPAERANAA